MALNIAQKVFGIALAVLLLMGTVAVYSIRLTADISYELDIVASKHLPVTEAVTRINIRILKQGVLLQRLFVLIEEKAPEKDIADSRDEFKSLDDEVVGEFNALRSLLRGEGIKSAASASNAVNILRQDVAAIEREYKNLARHSLLMADARESGDLQLFDSMLPALDERQTAADVEITTLRRHVEELTDAAVRRSAGNERKLLTVNSFLTALAAIVGLGFAAVVTKLLVRAVRNLVAGTQAVEAGNLDIEVKVTSTDEVGKLTGSFNHMIGELRLKERIKDTFGKYMDPRIVSNLLDHPEFIEPGGEKREMTVMFIDLKGFTSISEALKPADLVRMINTFFTHMTDAISANKGVVDKYMGDAVMAYWGPPFTGADEHAVLACRAARQALEHLERFREDVKSELGKDAAALDIDLRIGVSTGDMIVGTIGSKASMNFTVMGDPVNLGSRLEGASKAYGTRILISARTRELAGDQVKVREIDLIRVKGKTEPTRIFELGGTDETNQALPAPASEHFREGLEAYRKMDWDGAEKAFAECLALQPGDPPSMVYLERIRQLRAAPPPAGWNGVWVFETK